MRKSELYALVKTEFLEYEYDFDKCDFTIEKQPKDFTLIREMAVTKRNVIKY